MARIARSSLGIVLGAFSASVSLLLSGCGIGVSAGPASYALPKVSGMVHGGDAPIWHGRVRMYITNSGGYGAAATEIDATSDSGGSGGVYTDGYGSFTIDNSTYPYTCTSNQFAYITVTGGDTGGLTNGSGAITPVPNNNSVQMVALGNCSTLADPASQAATHVFLSEVSTAAAAYALSNFIGEDPSHLGDGDQRVWVNAPSTNNDPTGSCTTSSGVTTSCVGAGLAHAFANATALVNAVASGSMPSGAANSTLSTNSAASIPVALLNTLGNIQMACVNSTGGAATSGTANDGSACGRLFSYTTLPTGFSTPGGLPAVPSDNLAAMVNLAKHPTGFNSSAVSNLFNLVPPQSAFAPTLASKPTDYSLAIAYNSITVSSTTTNFVAPVSLTLDPSGDVFLDDQQSGATGVYAFQNNGTPLWVKTNSTQNDPKQAATDTLGHVYVANDNSSTSTNEVFLCFAQSDGTPCTSVSGTSYLWSLAIDRSNNLWAGRSTAGSTFYQLQRYNQASSYSSSPIALYAKQYVEAIAIDQYQNVFAAGYSSSSSTASSYIYIPKNATGWGTAVQTSEPTYGSSSTAYGALGIAIDGSNNVLLANHSSQTKVVPTYDGNHYVTGATATSYSLTSGSAPSWGQVDGAGIFWYGGTGSSVVGNSTTGSLATALPCYAPASATACGTSGTTAFQNPNSLAIDDAGTMWVAYSGASSAQMGMYEIIGTAAPTWSQLSYNYPGVKP